MSVLLLGLKRCSGIFRNLCRGILHNQCWGILHNLRRGILNGLYRPDLCLLIFLAAHAWNCLNRPSPFSVGF